jgi:hypothetical protein
MKHLIAMLLLLCPVASLAQPRAGDSEPAVIVGDISTNGLVPLVQPYTISTAPHFAVLVQFPKADSIRRIALGDSNYFLAEADKDDPHYAIVKQIKASSGRVPIETNMLVYMASGRVVNIMLKAGKLAETAYAIDYAVPKAQPAPDPPPPSAGEVEKTRRERERIQIADKLLDEVRASPKKDSAITAGGLTFHYYRTERLDELAFVAFDVENTSNAVIDVEEPQVNLVTATEKGKDRKKNPTAKLEPIQLVQSSVSLRQLPPGGRAVCLVAFKPPVHDRDQHVVLSITNRATADQPVTFRIE